jgi:tRNA(Leu) C34 or U34 (ribose-2'-O)-methylase TrmL
MEKSNVKIGLCNPKSPDNVGSVMRAAANYRVSSVVYTGDRYPRALKYRTDLADTSRKRGKNISLAARLIF